MEMICEVVFDGVCDEFLYLIVVVIDDIVLCEGIDLIDVYVFIVVECDS